jgi:hypothetical protein
MRRGIWIIVGLLAAPAALARPTGAPTAYDLPYCDEVYTYCLQGHSKAECDRLAAEAKQRGVWRLDFEHAGYPETDIFTVSVVKKAGSADTYIETRQFGCHAHP